MVDRKVRAIERGQLELAWVLGVTDNPIVKNYIVKAMTDLAVRKKELIKKIEEDEKNNRNNNSRT